ncbi:MAG: O-antigen ligase family protein [Pirellulales bacterium]
MLAAPPAQVGRKLKLAGVSINGALLFVTSILVVFSGFTGFRPDVFGLMLHPYLVPVAVAFVFLVLSKLALFPARVLVGLLAFMTIYVFSMLSAGMQGMGEVFRIGSGIVTIVTCALLVNRRGDFVAGAFGLSIAIAILAVNGLKEESRLGVEAIEGANKNSYSVYALPAMLMAGFVCLHMPETKSWIKTVLIACTLPALAAIFMSANRSGYLGCALIGLMLFWDRRGKGLLLVGALAAGLMIWLAQFGTTEVFSQRMQQTTEGNESDEYRKHILLACLRIGLENPVLGVSPQRLPFIIGRYTQIMHSHKAVDSHNVFGHLFAGSGAICILALFLTAWSLWFWKPRDGVPIGGKEDPLREARTLVRMLLVLWVVRGMFTREIMYNPSFNIAIGLCIGLCILAEKVRAATPRPVVRPNWMPPSLWKPNMPHA